MIAIIVLLSNIQILQVVGFIALAGAAALTLWSMVLYLKAAAPYMRTSVDKK